MRYFAEHWSMIRVIDAIAAVKYMADHAEPEPVYCAHFGCGLRLTATEQLYGPRCQAHNVKHPVDVTDFIRYE